MNCDKLQELLQNGSLIIDVRHPDEFVKGNIAGSINIPLHQIPHNLDQIKDKSVFLYCRSGARSELAKQYLLTEGVDAHNLGGINDYIGCVNF